VSISRRYQRLTYAATVEDAQVAGQPLARVMTGNVGAPTPDLELSTAAA